MPVCTSQATFYRDAAFRIISAKHIAGLDLAITAPLIACLQDTIAPKPQPPKPYSVASGPSHPITMAHTHTPYTLHVTHSRMSWNNS